MKKTIKLLILIVLSIFLNFINVEALSSTLGPITQEGDRVLDNCGSDSCYGLALKVSGSTPVICTSYEKTTPAAGNATCSISGDWSARIRYSVAAIINKAKSNISATHITNNYFAAEMAINRFLYNKGAGGSNIAGTGLSSTYRTLYSNYLDVANEAYDNYSSDSKVEIELSKSTLSFSLKGDNYESNSISVSGVDSYKVATNVGSVTKSGSSFKIVVPASNISSSKTVRVTVSASKDLNQARNYDCGSSYQTITPVALETITKSDSVEISGTITVSKPEATLTIKKVDASGNYLSGATINVTGPNNYTKTIKTTNSAIVLENLDLGTYIITETKAPSGYTKANSKKMIFTESNLSGTVTLENKKNKITISKLDVTGKNELPGAKLQIKNSSGTIVEEWISTAQPKIIEGLAPGNYTLIEIIAPSGYTLSSEEVKFTITEDTSTLSVSMSNKLNKIEISKLDAANKKLLPGATLEIQDEKGNIVKYCTDEKGNKNTECKWISGDSIYKIEGIPVGVYYLVETKAPSGYQLNTKKVKFEVTKDTETIKVKMENKKNLVKISKVNSVDKKLLPGATLEIQDEKGNIVKYCTDEKGNKNTECKWVSGDSIYKIEGIPVGKYYLVEIKAPSGYELNTKKIEFNIKETDDVIEVELVNQLEVEVPDTLSARSALLLSIAMFDIALGIGIITYVKKYKTQE